MKKLIRGLVIGNQKYFDSWTEYRQVLLSGQFGVIAICALLLFTAVSLVRGNYFTVPIFASGLISVCLSMWLHRRGHHCLANTALYPSLIIIIYLVTSSESPANGGFLSFVPVAIGAFASFDYKHRKLAFMVSSFACFMFLAATFVDFRLLPWREYSKEEMLFNMLLNFIVAFPASMLAVLMLLRLNHRNARQLMESNALLKKSNEELDRFIYSTSHDLRAPLTSVLGLINLSEKSNNITELHTYMGMMRGRINALDKFIRDITDYSRNNRTDIARTTIKLYPFAMEIWESLKFNHRAETIHFEMDFDADFSIETDPHRLRVILSNLIANAIRYHDSGKEFRFIRLSCKRTEKSFVLNVEDNGQGIAPEHHKKIFQMFFRASEQSTGSGLGLYIVQEAIQKLSGDVQLQSAPAQGSTFIVSIPTKRTSA